MYGKGWKRTLRNKSQFDHQKGVGGRAKTEFLPPPKPPIFLHVPSPSTEPLGGSRPASPHSARRPRWAWCAARLLASPRRGRCSDWPPKSCCQVTGHHLEAKAKRRPRVVGGRRVGASFGSLVGASRLLRRLLLWRGWTGGRRPKICLATHCCEEMAMK